MLSTTEQQAVWAINEWCVAARMSPAFFFQESKGRLRPQRRTAAAAQSSSNRRVNITSASPAKPHRRGRKSRRCFDGP